MFKSIRALIIDYPLNNYVGHGKYGNEAIVAYVN